MLDRQIHCYRVRSSTHRLVTADSDRRLITPKCLGRCPPSQGYRGRAENSLDYPHVRSDCGYGLGVVLDWVVHRVRLDGPSGPLRRGRYRRRRFLRRGRAVFCVKTCL